MQKTMTTAATIIADALAEIGAIGAGDAVAPNDASLALRKLNQIAQRWANTRLMIPALTEIAVTLNGAASYLVGPGGATVTLRPVKVNSATATDANGTEYPVEVLTRDRWDAIAVKNVTGGPPSLVWYEPVNTNGRIHVYPKASGYTLKLDCQVLLTTFALASDISLPDGYESALTLTLAVDCAGAFGVKASQDLRMRAMGARAAIHRTNTEPLWLSIDSGGEPFMIERGY